MAVTQRQHDLAGILVAVGGLTTFLVVPPAVAADTWCRDAAAEVPADLALVGRWAPGTVPPFRASSRDRVEAGVSLAFTLDRVHLSGAWSYLSDEYPTGARVSGPGDVSLGTVVTVWRPGPWSFEIGWGAKMPNATDESQLGSDETDVAFGLGAGYRAGAWAMRLGLGLGIWGNPLRFANQDDVVLLRLDARYAGAWWVLGPRLSADLPSDRNPARVLVGGSARVGGAWGAELVGEAGLTPAAADVRLTLHLGYAGPLGGENSALK